MSLEDYLNGRYRPSTAITYLREINTYRRACKGSARASRADVVAYIGLVRTRNNKASSLGGLLSSLKVYYAYLCASGKRKDNPARSIRLRDRRSKDIQLQDLFSEEELSGLIDCGTERRRERAPLLLVRNKVLRGFLIYQAALPAELGIMEVGDVDLEAGTVRLRSTAMTNGRTLPLRGAQVVLLQSYLGEVRAQLLGERESPRLLLSERGNEMDNTDITEHILRSFAGLYGTRSVTCQKIRQSVITNLLKRGVDLRLVQVFAGHKWASTTERYKQSNIDTLKAAVTKHHPFA